MSVRDELYDLLSNPMDLPPEFWGYATQNWLKDAPVFPISQVFGFLQFTVQRQLTDASESTTSTTYTDLATVGPTITGLSPGSYLVIVSAKIANSGAGGSVMSPSYNAATPSDGDAAIVTLPAATEEVSAFGVGTTTFTGANNTVTAQYRVTAGTGYFQHRNLVVVKYANQ